MRLWVWTLSVMMGVGMMMFSNGTLVRAQEGTTSVSTDEVVEADGETVIVEAKGLVCEFCAKSLEKVFMKRPEVSGISVDLTSKEVEINFKTGQTLDDAEITRLIEYGGYSVTKIRRRASDPS
jgi:copper chaperone CopZ